MKNCSKRHWRRLLKKEREVFCNKLLVNNANEAAPIYSFDNALDQNENHMNLSTSSEVNFVRKKTFKQKIVDWYFKNKPSWQCFEELLRILSEENLDVPLSANSFIKQPDKLSLRNVFPGVYSHFGIKKQLSRIPSRILHDCDKIVIDINVDGLPLYNSSRNQLWPILIKIVDFPNISILPIGVYVGKSKPHNISNFLSDSVTELKELIENGILIDNNVKPIEVGALICDAPAKAFVCGIVEHTSSHGCTKCTQIGRKIGNTLTYSEISGEPISDTDFIARKYPHHHQKEFRCKQTPFEELGIKMITQVPIDAMHLIDLVMKKILVRINADKTNFRISKEIKENISQHLKSLKQYIPKEFSRYPRELNELCNWKATEFHQFLFYTGILVLKDRLNEDFYYELILLHCACRLLSCPKTYERNAENAQVLLEIFVENFPVIFGENSISHTVHCLLHISDCVKKFGPFANFSSYPFENCL